MLIVTLLFLIASNVFAAQPIRSTMKTVDSVYLGGGYFIIPAENSNGAYYDLASSLAFEIIRPNEDPLTLGRLHTSCSCITLETEKSSFGKGEQAIFHVRNVEPTPPEGQTYAFFIQITAPIRITLRYDVFVKTGDVINTPAMGTGYSAVEPGSAYEAVPSSADYVGVERILSLDDLTP